MSMPQPTVFLVDDDPAVLKSLTRLLRSAGWRVEPFSSPDAFLAGCDPLVPGCAVLDLAMPGQSGLDVQQRLAGSGHERPIVFLTGRGDVPSSVQALKAGAVDFLTKPVVDGDLLAAVAAAVERDRALRAARAEREAVGARFGTLTPREQEVMRHVVAGRLNKQIAADLGTVEKTVKVHRARIMEKMRADSLAALVRMAVTLGIEPPTS